MTDNYVDVEVVLKVVRPKSILVMASDGDQNGVWIPRSCINGADEVSLDGTSVPQKMTVRMFEWIAQREGLI